MSGTNIPGERRLWAAIRDLIRRVRNLESTSRLANAGVSPGSPARIRFYDQFGTVRMIVGSILTADEGFETESPMEAGEDNNMGILVFAANGITQLMKITDGTVRLSSLNVTQTNFGEVGLKIVSAGADYAGDLFLVVGADEHQRILITPDGQLRATRPANWSPYGHDGVGVQINPDLPGIEFSDSYLDVDASIRWAQHNVLQLSTGARLKGIFEDVRAIAITTYGPNLFVAALTASGSQSVGTANDAILQKFVPTVSKTISVVEWVANAAASGNYDIGIYDSFGQKIWSKGSTAAPGSSTLVEEAVSPTFDLTAGETYYAAWAADSTVPKIRGSALTVAGQSKDVDGNFSLLKFATSFPLPASLTLGSGAQETRTFFTAYRTA